LGSGFPHQTIDGTTFETGLCLLALIGDSSDDGGLSEGIILRFANGAEEFSAIEFGEENTGAILEKSVDVGGGPGS
jgi:hypothetical protein